MTILFAHGAGAPSSSPWMQGWAGRLATPGEVVATALSNGRHDSARRLTSRETEALIDLGWELWEGLAGFHQAWALPRTDEARLEIVSECLHALEVAFGYDPEEDTLHIETIYE